MALVEICANSFQSALHAQEGGAQRIELCTALAVGGLTPSPGTILLAREYLSIPVCVLIRPREGDFCYSDLEVNQIKEEIFFCKETGIDGIVVGILRPDGTVDRKVMEAFVKFAGSMEVIFHRAFDYTADPFAAMETLIDAGVKRILTAGKQTKAWDGRELIAALIQKANNRIAIMPGSGINTANARDIVDATGAKEIHLTAGNFISSSMQTSSDNVTLNATNGIPEYDYFETDVDKVRAIIREVGNV